MSSFPYPQATWAVVVGADRAYYEQVQALTGPEGAAVAFPSYCAERRFQLVGNQMRIGRRSVSRGLAPEIDLTGPPADPGIQPAARGPDRDAGRQLGRARPGFGQRHPRQRLRYRDRGPGTPA